MDIHDPKETPGLEVVAFHLYKIQHKFPVEGRKLFI